MSFVEQCGGVAQYIRVVCLSVLELFCELVFFLERAIVLGKGLMCILLQFVEGTDGLGTLQLLCESGDLINARCTTRFDYLFEVIICSLWVEIEF